MNSSPLLIIIVPWLYLLVIGLSVTAVAAVTAAFPVAVDDKVEISVEQLRQVLHDWIAQQQHQQQPKQRQEQHYDGNNNNNKKKETSSSSFSFSSQTVFDAADNLLQQIVESSSSSSRSSTPASNVQFYDDILVDLLNVYNSSDCFQYELDVSMTLQMFDDDDDEIYDDDMEDPVEAVVANAIRIFRKCRILVLRNVFRPTATNSNDKSYDGDAVDLTKYSDFVDNAPDGGTTTYGGDFYILKEDVDRFNFMLPKELVTSSPTIFANEFIINKILAHPTILGDNMILNHAGVIRAFAQDPDNDDSNRRPKRPRRPQYYHMDGSYVHIDEDQDETSGSTKDTSSNRQEYHHHYPSGHHLSPFAINMFTPVNVDLRLEHGPTDFCLGTSLLRGLSSNTMDGLYNHVMNQLLLQQQQQKDNTQSSSDSNSISCISSRSVSLSSILELLMFEWSVHYDSHSTGGGTIELELEKRQQNESTGGSSSGSSSNNIECPNAFTRTPLLNRGDVLLFDYMVTHRGGMNISPDYMARDLLFGMYSRPWYRDTTFDGGGSGSSSIDLEDDDDDILRCAYYESGIEYDPLCELRSLTSMTRFAVIDVRDDTAATTDYYEEL